MGLGIAAANGVAGGQDALQQLLAQRIAAKVYQDRLKQQEVENLFKSRQMDMQGRSLDQNEQFRRDQLDQQANRDAATASDREQDNNRALNDQIPAGTFLEPNNPLAGRLRTVGGVTPQEERPRVDVGPLLPGDTGAEKPKGFIKTRSQSQQVAETNRADKQTDNERAMQMLQRQIDADKEAGRHNRAMEARPVGGQNPQPQVFYGNDGKPHALQFVGGVSREIPLPEGMAGKTNPVTSQERNRTSMAKSVQSRFDEIQGQLDEAEKMGLLGPSAGRVSDFLAGKVGSTGDETKDDLLGQLRMNLTAVRSGFASLHGRGGANAGIARELESKMDQGRMSHAELTGALKAMRGWVDDYAGGGSKPAGGGSKIKSITEIK